MGASGKRHLGALRVTPQRVQERGRNAALRSDRAAECYFTVRLRALRFLRTLPACHLAWHLLSSKVDLRPQQFSDLSR
jgi:hypothetical protein